MFQVQTSQSLKITDKVIGEETTRRLFNNHSQCQHMTKLDIMYKIPAKDDIVNVTTLFRVLSPFSFKGVIIFWSLMQVNLVKQFYSLSNETFIKTKIHLT